MIERDAMRRIKRDTDDFWRAKVATPAFHELASGKEIGHRIADYVDDETTAMLKVTYETQHEIDGLGRRRPRSMGDVWLRSQGMYNPINIKAGEAGKNGQPNMVSLTKLLDALMARTIDSYYLLIVKMRMKELPASAEFDASKIDLTSIVPNVYFVDMLDYIDFITFDAGPGQVMLREQSFYEFSDSRQVPPQQDMTTKVGRLIALLEDGDLRLIANRKKKMERLRHDFERYSRGDGHIVAQGGLKLG